MNYPPPPNPFIQQKSNEPEPYRGLVTGGIVVCSILMLVIFIALIGAVSRANMKRRLREIEYSERALRDSMGTPAADTAGDDISSMQEADEGSNYYNYDADTQRDENNTEYENIRNNIPDTSADRDEIITVLDHLRSRTNAIGDQIHHLYNGFSDTVSQVYDANEEVTRSYFKISGRAEELKGMLHDYREQTVQEISSLRGIAATDLRNSMPLYDISPSGYARGWEDSKFRGSTDDALSYLKDLDTQLRAFEAAALNSIPHTYVH